MDWKLEVVVAPVSDVERAREFYVDRLGFRLDTDFAPNEDFRVIQVTPPGSGCSIVFGTGLGGGVAPGSLKGPHLVVEDIDAARAELIGRGVDVGEIQDFGGGVRGAAFSDPDGNSFELQEMAWRTGAASYAFCARK